MRRSRLGLALCMAALSGPLCAGEIGSKLAAYSSAGAGVGAVLGTAVATLPYLQSKEPYDLYTGAGAGLMAGAGIGFILGVIDLATAPDDPAQASIPSDHHLDLALLPGGWLARYTLTF